MPYQQINELLQKFFNGNISDEEKETLNQWIMNSEDEEQLQEQMELAWQQHQPVNALSGEKADAMLLAILQQGQQSSMNSVKRINRKRWMAAASILVLIAAGSFWLMEKKKTEQPVPATALAEGVPAPDRNRASITLADGNKVYLDSLQQGATVNETNGGFTIGKDASVAYAASKEPVEKTEIMNTLNNPRGSRIATITLADGTKVWLNAGSSITYPVNFTGNERRVSVTGEAYFDVKPMAAKPFHVKRDNVDIAVLGTEFNVRGYDFNNKGSNYITLVKGSVQINVRQQQLILRPGETAHTRDTALIQQGLDMEDVIAWKAGWFRFSSSYIFLITHELENWYDVNITLDPKLLGKKFSGIISRDSNISEVLDLLKHAGINSTIEGKKIKLYP